MTAPRRIVPSHTHFITRRCTQRQFLLRPCPLARQIFLYCLGEAANRYAVTINAFLAMSNHSHLVVRDNLGNLPLFTSHLHKMIARATNVLHGRTENFWATRQANAVYLVGAEDRFAKLAYVHANPVAAHLVERAEEWPGASSLAQHLSGEPEVVTRPPCFFRSDGPMPFEVELRVERVDGFDHLTKAEWAERVGSAAASAERAARDERRDKGISVLGRAAIIATSPTDHPKTSAEVAAPIPHVACRDVERRKAELAALGRFRAAYREARAGIRDGKPDVRFPEGTYRPWKTRGPTPGP